MGRKRLIILLIPVTMMSACNFYSKKDKLNTYRKITTINDSLDKMTREWNRLLLLAIGGKNFSTLRPYRLEIARFLDRNRSAVANLKVNPLSQNLLDSEEVFLSTQANVVAEQYPVFEQYTNVTPNEIVQEEVKHVSKQKDTVMATTVAIKKSLEHFASKTGLHR